MERRLSRNLIERVIQQVCDQVDGDWLLVGGGAVALWLNETRTTEDIDLVELTSQPSHRLDLLKIADSLGLPIEAVNSAADFFIRKVEGWNEDIVLLHTGARGHVFRPSSTSFLLMKLARLSEQDLEDCRALLSRPEREEPLDRTRLIAALDALEQTSDTALAARRRALRELIDLAR